MRKTFCLLLSLCLILLSFNAINAESTAPIDTSNAINAESTAPIDTSLVKSAMLIEAASGKTIFEYNSEAPLAIAGLTRLPALLIICEAFDSGAITEETSVTVSGKSAAVKGATAFLSEGEQISAADLLRAAIMINAGDAIHALASTICGSESAAADRINTRLSELGISSQYTDIIGNDCTLSALDLTKIGSALLKCASFKKYSSLFYESLEHSNGSKPTELANPNKLVKQYSGCSGIATGSSSDAGYCGVFAAERGGTSYLAVCIGAANSSDRFATGIELLDYGFASFRSTKVISAGDKVDTVQVFGAIETEVNIVAEKDLTLLLSTTDAKYIPESQYETSLTAPIKQGQILGTLKYLNSAGEEIGSVNLIAEKAVEAASLLDYLGLLFKCWIA